MDGIVRLAETYILLRQDGCVLFFDFMAKFDFDEQSVAICTVKFFNGSQEIIGKKTEDGQIVHFIDKVFKGTVPFQCYVQ
jgi:hypothetical protein